LYRFRGGFGRGDIPARTIGLNSRSLRPSGETLCVRT
jgi:hypothetical protein